MRKWSVWAWPTLFLSVVAYGGNGQSENDPSPPSILQYTLESPQGPVRVTVGSAVNAAERSAAAELIKHEAEGRPLEAVVIDDTDQIPADAKDLLEKTGAVAPSKPLPWRYQKNKRRLWFCGMRFALDFSATTVLILSHHALPLNVTVAYAGAGAFLAGVLQWHAVALNEGLDHSIVLAALKKRGIDVGSGFWRGFIENFEYAAKFGALDAAYLSLTAGALIAAASYYGMHCGAGDLLSLAVFGEVSFLTIAAEGMIDKWAIRKMNQWKQQFPEQPYIAEFRTELTAAITSSISIILSLPSMLKIPVTEVSLMGYTIVGGILMTKDWIKEKWRALFGKKATPCERAVEPIETQPTSSPPTQIGRRSARFGLRPSWPTHIPKSSQPC